MTTTVADVMTTKVATVPEKARYHDIVAVLRRRGVSALPVLDPGRRVIGVVSDADLLGMLPSRELPAGAIRLAWQLRQWTRASGPSAASLMTTPVVSIGPDAAIAEAARLMQARHLRRLPVVDSQGRLAGIVSRADLLSVFERPDELIRDEVMTGVIAARFGLNPRAFKVVVRSGHVTIAGPVDHRAVALRLLGAAWQVEGVLAVRDQLCYPAEEGLDRMARPRRTPAVVGRVSVCRCCR
jgi:CBS-domain-containing membrane protein